MKKLKNGFKTGPQMKVQQCNNCERVYVLPLDSACTLKCPSRCGGHIGKWYTGFVYEIEKATGIKQIDWENL